MAHPEFPHVPEGREPGRQTRRTARQYAGGEKWGGWMARAFRVDGPGRVENVRITVDRRELRRGDEIVGRVEVLDGRQLPQGTVLMLLCEVRHSVERGTGEDRSLTEERDILYQHDEPLAPSPATQEVRFRVPEDSAYSWEGTMLSFSWRVVMLEPSGGEEPNVLMTPFWVTP